MDRPLRLVAVAALSVAAMAILGGCPFMTKPEEKPPTPTVTYLPRTSAENLLKNLKTAYVHRQAAPYESLLATDFEFFFAEEDQHIAEKYTRADEVEVNQNMCNSSDVDYVQLDFSVGDLLPDPTKADPKYPDRNLWKLTATNVDLELRRREGGDSKTYQLQNGIQNFWFREESWVDPKNGLKVWTIVQWQEVTG